MIKYESPPQYLYFHIESYVFFISPSVSTHIIIGGCENEEMELVPRMGDTWEQSLVEKGLTGTVKCTYH